MWWKLHFWYFSRTRRLYLSFVYRRPFSTFLKQFQQCHNYSFYKWENGSLSIIGIGGCWSFRSLKGCLFRPPFFTCRTKQVARLQSEDLRLLFIAVESLRKYKWPQSRIVEGLCPQSWNNLRIVCIPVQQGNWVSGLLLFWNGGEATHWFPLHNYQTIVPNNPASW